MNVPTLSPTPRYSREEIERRLGFKPKRTPVPAPAPARPTSTELQRRAADVPREVHEAIVKLTDVAYRRCPSCDRNVNAVYGNLRYDCPECGTGTSPLRGEDVDRILTRALYRIQDLDTARTIIAELTWRQLKGQARRLGRTLRRPGEGPPPPKREGRRLKSPPPKEWGPPMGRSLEERFWEKVDKSAPDACWVWTAGHGPAGKPYFTIGEGRGGTCAQRVAHELVHGEPAPKQTIQTCDTPDCVNPDHYRARGKGIGKAWICG